MSHNSPILNEYICIKHKVKAVLIDIPDKGSFMAICDKCEKEELRSTVLTKEDLNKALALLRRKSEKNRGLWMRVDPNSFLGDMIAILVPDARQAEREEIRKKVDILRQWLNERDTNKLVTCEELEYFLFFDPQKYKKAWHKKGVLMANKIQEKLK